MVLYIQTIETPIGSMLVCSTEHSICLLEFMDGKHVLRHVIEMQKEHRCEPIEVSSPPIELLKSELADYFNRSLSRFTVPIQLPLATPFQQEVWNELIKIPFGERISYSELAERIGRPGAYRPVAQAVAQNRLMILVPCHRIVGIDGSLTGFSGGIECKQQLLLLETTDR